MDTQLCILCGNPADSLGLDDNKLYCGDCVFSGTAPQQSFEWILSDETLACSQGSIQKIVVKCSFDES